MTQQSKLWEVPDPLWHRIEALLDAVDRKKPRGRPRVDRRRIMDGVLFKIRTGCRWNHIPKVYGSDATIHRTFQRWRRLGVFEQVWALLVAESPELPKLDWKLGPVKEKRTGEPRAGTKPPGTGPQEQERAS